jgi:hypothetical protein
MRRLGLLNVQVWFFRFRRLQRQVKCFEFNWSHHAEGLVAHADGDRSVAIQVTIASFSSSFSQRRVSRALFCGSELKDSVAVLSPADATRPIEQSVIAQDSNEGL